MIRWFLNNWQGRGRNLIWDNNRYLPGGPEKYHEKIRHDTSLPTENWTQSFHIRSRSATHATMMSCNMFLYKKKSSSTFQTMSCPPNGRSSSCVAPQTYSSRFLGFGILFIATGDPPVAKASPYRRQHNTRYAYIRAPCGIRKQSSRRRRFTTARLPWSALVALANHNH
jgi:hypothetical protein